MTNPTSPATLPKLYSTGDWIAFYRDGRIVMDEVAYPPHQSITGYQTYQTRSHGEVRHADVLEGRRHVA